MKKLDRRHVPTDKRGCQNLMTIKMTKTEGSKDMWVQRQTKEFEWDKSCEIDHC